jgi:LCP family protein required for cell wall assembly
MGIMVVQRLTRFERLAFQKKGVYNHLQKLTNTDWGIYEMGDSLSRSSKKKTKRRWVWLTLTAVFICIFIYGGLYAYDIYHSVKSTYKPIPERPKSEKREETVSIQEQDPVSFLLLGVDKRANDPGRSDTMMVATLNPAKQSMILFNIPRDTYVDIVGKGIKDKINHAYAYGGVEMAIHTVENFLDIPIDYYAEINMQGFREAIDALGGVAVNVPFTFEFGGILFEEGPMFMDGETAMKYVQMRKLDPRGDFGRNERQQQVIKAILKQSLSVKNFNKVDNVIETVGNHLKTSVAPSDYMSLQEIYRNLDTNQIESFQIEGQGQMIDGIYYYIVDDAERERVSQRLKEHLDLQSEYTQT